MSDKVQLKQEELVGNEVVLQDINPFTTTDAVFNPENGLMLLQELQKMWNAINNKLSRIVNSVNNRTGTVTLTAEDVGLGKVDNKSFEDIKKWVVEQNQQDFNSKRLKLFNNLQEVDELMATNDPIHDGTPFFSTAGYGEDNLSYIGYIYLSGTPKTLNHSILPVDIVGSTDDSIIYNEIVGSKDYTKGKIGINIHPDEDALQIIHGASKLQSGLKLNKDKLLGHFEKVEGVYGDGTIEDDNSLFYWDPDTTPINAPNAIVFIDDQRVIWEGLKIRRSDLTVGHLFICNFKDYRTVDEDCTVHVPAGMCVSFMCRTPALGRVETIPTDEIPTCLIRFYSMTTYPGWGLKEFDTHTSGVNDVSVSLKLATGTRVLLNGSKNLVNVSGLQVFAGRDDQNVTTPEEPSGNSRVRVNFPEGPIPAYNFGGVCTYGGIGIIPDDSLMLAPYELYGPGNANGDTHIDKFGDEAPYGSKVFGNHHLVSEDYKAAAQKKSNGFLEDMCLVGINLEKAIDDQTVHCVDHEGIYRAANLSGLRLMRPWRAAGEDNKYKNMTTEFFGVNDNDSDVHSAIVSPRHFEDIDHSGGLSVNVGSFLEISIPADYPESQDEYWDGGKVCVRIGDGLEGEPITYEDPEDPTSRQMTGNRIQVKCGEGLNLNADTKAVEVNIDTDVLEFKHETGEPEGTPGKLTIKNYAPVTTPLKFVDAYNNELVYSPTDNDPEEPVDPDDPDAPQPPVPFVINLGPGLKIEE